MNYMKYILDLIHQIQYNILYQSKIKYENNDGTINFSVCPPSGLNSELSPYEQEFFDKITSEINKVNVWYVSKLQEYEKMYQVLQQQVDMYDNTYMSILQKYKSTRYLQDNFKELYRGLRYLENFSTLNEMGFTKVLKKHDKILQYRSRCTVISTIHKLYFCRKHLLNSLINKTESLWANVYYLILRHSIKVIEII